MAITPAPWSSIDKSNRHILLQIPLPVLRALADSDLESAQAASEIKLTPYLISPRCVSVWKMRVTQIEEDPSDAVWVTRLVMDTETGAVVGRAGYHGKPNSSGMVEVGYSIDSSERRKGHARAVLRILLDVARGDESVRTVRASIRPDNTASRNLVEQYGFEQVGEQWDDVDGLEIIHEVSVVC